MSFSSSAETFSKVLAGNVEDCRLEAEILDQAGNLVAVLYEDQTGWHLNALDKNRVDEQIPSAFITRLQRELVHYVNRRGDNVPEGMTRAGVALWLMEKDDGTAMGVTL